MSLAAYVPATAIAVMLQSFVQTTTGTAYAYLEVRRPGRAPRRVAYFVSGANAAARIRVTGWRF